eukprot:Gb_26183 [translate_table: standard]
MAKKSLGHVGTWAEEAEREEAERKDQEAKEALAGNKQKKKKNQTFTISEITRGQYVGPGGRSRPLPDARGFLADDRNSLHAGPTDRSEDQSHGTGLRSFDRRLPDRAPSYNNRDPPPRSNAPLTEKSGYSYEDADRKPTREREIIPSRADQVDDWGSAKRFVASAPRENYDRRQVIESQGERRRFQFQDRTASVLESQPPSYEDHNETKNKLGELPQQQTRVRSDPFAGARPRELVLAEKKPELPDFKASKDKDKAAIAKDVVIGKDKEKDVRPSSSSSRSGRPPTPDVKASRGPDVEFQTASKPKVDPFGDAKPREVLLEERGLDWRKIDLELEHRSVVRSVFLEYPAPARSPNRSESEEEKKLKEEISALEKLVKNHNDGDGRKAVDGIGHIDIEHMDNLRMQLTQKESQLRELTLELDDKVRFSQKVDRPGSRSGRSDYARKPGLVSERLDISRGYAPERPVSLSGCGEMSREYDGERSSFSSRDGDMSRGFEPERQGSFAGHGGMVGGYDRLDVTGSGFDRPATRSGPDDFIGGYDINRSDFHSGRGGYSPGYDADRSGPHSGYTEFFQGNGSERPSSHSGHIDVTRGYNSERPDSRSRHGSIPRGYDSERPGSGSWRGDARGYDSERPGSDSWHNDARQYESPRPASNSGRGDTVRGFNPERTVSLPGRENLLRGYDIERPGMHAGFNESPKRSVFERLGPQPGHRELARLHDAGGPRSRPGSVDSYKGFDETVGWHSGNEETGRHYEVGRSHAPYESGRMGPWAGRSDTRRGYESYRGPEGRSDDEYISDKGGRFGQQDFNRRGNFREQDYHRRGNYGLHNKFDQVRGIRLIHR